MYADYVGLWKVENESDPVCVKSNWLCYVTGGCKLTWASRLQTEIALSTVEAEYIALSTAMKDLLPGRALLKDIGAKLQLSFCKESVIMSKVWEDNTGTIRLAEAAYKVTFCTKHIAVKYHLFHTHTFSQVANHFIASGWYI